ncbi:hypothetical protein CDL12_26680 [Handroanthus impetiginosus]|uniref:Protein KAKU4 n=1 Tax=Handroanthus impetiginosus TaxID=429701 RepID=A0A2G9G7A3_9LAMI|nr:hypothetical protein CDL12_26680 [Handroanthus impetiginosus]
MATSRSGAGGKIVSNRRQQRLAATPYDRPPPQPFAHPPPRSPNWFTGIIVPSARALASGAGKILSTIFSESESSSSEDEGSGSEDDVDNDNHYETPHAGLNTLNEKNGALRETPQSGQETKFGVWRTETKRVIERLISHETFSREECDRLIRMLNSRVIDRSTEAGDKSLFLGSAGKMVDHEDVDIYNKAIQEAKTWFREKKVGSSSGTQLAHGTSNLNSTGLEHVESGGGSPADVARSYMKDRPPWASPTRNVELRTPLTTTVKLFKDGTLYSVGHDSFSSSKRRNSLASGSWNIQEELRRVRSKATDDMLRTPSTKIDPSLFAVAKIKEESIGAGRVVSALGERTMGPEFLSKTKPIDVLIDAGVSSDSALAALAPRQDDKASEAHLSKPATSVSGNNEDSEAVQTDGECAASKFLNLPSPDHAEEQHADPHVSKINGPLATEATEIGRKQSVNGLASSKSSLSAGVATGQNSKQHDEENNNSDINEKKSVNTSNVEGNCELLSEAYMEVPIVTETDSIASGSPNSMGVQCEELSQDVAEPSPKEKADVVTQKPQGRKSGKNNRRGRGRGK